MFPGSGDAIPSREAVDGMEYSLSVLKEALRKYSVVPVVTRNLVAVSAALKSGRAAAGLVRMRQEAVFGVASLACGSMC